MRGALFIATFALGCSNAGGGDAGADASADCAWNALIPDATQYACDAEPADASGCVGDPSTGDGSEVHPLGCQAITTSASGADFRCQQMKCGCSPLACYCQVPFGDAGPQWVCPN